MEEVIELTKAEKIAKDHFMYLCKEGSFVACDNEISKVDYNLPAWCDPEKCKRGQKYFHSNRCGILCSNLIGLYCLLADPKGIKVLMCTGRSSTSETARKRYLSTIVHTLTWYDVEISPGSKSMESLKRVRKMHYHSSESAKSLGIGHITQMELSLTAFAFMGLAILHPYMFGIQCDNKEDREAFVHLWAVICHLLGVEDRFNICLLPFDALIVLFQIMVRYILLPLIQIETPDFKHMMQALIDGMKSFLYSPNYETDIFAIRRVLGVPGYQYSTGKLANMHCRSLLNQKDVDELNDVRYQLHGDDFKLFSIDIPVIEVIRGKVKESFTYHDENKNPCRNSTYLKWNGGKETTLDYLRKLMQLNTSDIVTLRFINYEKEWTNNINDSKFYQLSFAARLRFKIRLFVVKVYENSVGRYLVDVFLSFILYRMRKANKNLSGKCCM